MEEQPNPTLQPQNPTPGVTPGVDHGPRSGHELLSWIVIILASVVGAYFINPYFSKLSEKDIEPTPVVNQQQDETADLALSEVEGWQTYRNEEFGFEVKLDGSWNGYKVLSTKDNIFYFCLPTNVTTYPDSSCGENTYNNYGSIFAISVHSPEEWMEIQNSDGPKAIFIDSDKNYFFGFSRAQDAPEDLASQWNQYNDINQILSTFRFIDSTDTSTWQTYRNEEFGFELKYPEGWEVVYEGGIGVYLTPTSLKDGYETPTLGITPTAKENKSIQEIYSSIDFDKECETTSFGGKVAYDCTPVISFAGERVVLIDYNEDYILNITDLFNDNISHQILSTFRFIDSVMDEGISESKEALLRLADKLDAGDIEGALQFFSSSPLNRDVLSGLSPELRSNFAQSLRDAKIIKIDGNLHVYELPTFAPDVPTSEISLAGSEPGNWIIISW
ncbi:MAG: hypothetical protein Q8Q06_04055 [bacterium]|nr:hypothetical protein [bacterium]